MYSASLSSATDADYATSAIYIRVVGSLWLLL